MRKYLAVLLIVFGLVLASSAVNAFDYKDWMPLLPDSIAEMEKQGDPDGMNMEKGGQSWSTISQKYSDGQENNAQLTIVTGSDAPGMKKFNTLHRFSGETGKRKVKTLDISGHKAVLNLDKKGGSNSLLIQAQENTMVIINTSSFDSENGLVSLAEDIPLAEIADAVK